MTHTSQRRGLEPSHPGEEIIVLAMVPRQHKEEAGVRNAMSELALKMLSHEPHLWMSHNFPELDIQRLGSLQTLIRWMHKIRPKATQRLLFREVASQSSVITAIYTDRGKVVELLNDIKGQWCQRNRQQGYPVSVVLSGLFGDLHQCCKKTGTTEHTYLHTLGTFGKTASLPPEEHLELITMCGHGLISANRVKRLEELVRRRAVPPREAAEEVARPCVCGIVNKKRAEELFRKMTRL